MRKLDGKRLLATLMGRWQDHIKMTLKEVGYGLDSSAQNRGQWHAIVNTVMNLLNLQTSGNFWKELKFYSSVGIIPSSSKNVLETCG
jgi:hypothetical protein